MDSSEAGADEKDRRIWLLIGKRQSIIFIIHYKLFIIFDKGK
jgi:hypothetical protein